MKRALFFTLVIASLLASPLVVALAAPRHQAATDQARQLLDLLTPQERVGQLFLVTFQGQDVSAETQIYDLIANYYIGGVALQAGNNNFTAGDLALQQVVTLTRQLQMDRWAASQQSRLDPNSNQTFTPQFIPLFVGLSQEGDGAPYDQIINGTTTLPNEMALGATWDPSLARQVGNLLGSEIAALGFNLLLGPSLDVLETPHMDTASDLGTRTFGGDPYWVGRMGAAYIQGVHEGSAGKVMVVAKHFPGFGASDRLPEDEVATVRRSLDQLNSFDLAPFFDVTGNALAPEQRVDALLVSHIRYQGFQGNIRLTTRPVSFDPQALSQLISLPSLQKWREQGGVLVSDDLGSRAVRNYYDFTSQTFDMPRRVALNAFQAGNDLLYVADFSSGDMDSYTSAVRTLEFFAQKYREDPFFAQRVDEAVLRILTQKFQLYQNFSLGTVLVSPSRLSQVGKGSAVTLAVAQQSATLISPSSNELEVTLPDPPNQSDRIVFITDTRSARQCTRCNPQPLLAVDALQKVILRRYGPQAGGQVAPNNLSSFSLEDVQSMLQAGKGDSDLEKALRRANWIIFAMLDNTGATPAYATLNAFLAERYDLFQQKRLIVFAFNAPYYLDATNISKLSAYYAMYSKTPQFVDVSAYILFQELRPRGALPVSVSGVYDLNAALFPDPNQVISLELDLPETLPETPTQTAATPAPLAGYTQGDVIPIRTGLIVDNNGHPVPDGTSVNFILSMGGETISPLQTEITRDGIARTTIQATNPGVLEVRAESELAKQSQPLRFDIQPQILGSVTEPPPSPTPTESPSPTPTPTATPEPPATSAPPQPKQPQFGDWIMAVLVTAAIAWSVFRIAALAGQVRWGVRSGFLAFIGGMLAYSYLATQMPGSERFLRASVAQGVFLVTLLGAGIGLLVTWLWRMASAAAREVTS